MGFFNKNSIVCISVALFMSLLISCKSSDDSTEKNNEKTDIQTSNSQNIQDTEQEKTTTVEVTQTQASKTVTTTTVLTTTTVPETTTVVTETTTSITTTEQEHDTGELLNTYYYTRRDDDLENYLIKTEYYEGKVMIYFSEGSLKGRSFKYSSVYCFTADFNEIIEDEENKSYNEKFMVDGDVLTIYYDEPSKISGITFSDYMIRYLDSEQYGMLMKRRTSNINVDQYIGNKEYYFTREEIEEVESRKARINEVLSEELAKIAGIWENEEHTIRLDIKENENGRLVEKYENIDGEWTLLKTIRVDYINIEYKEVQDLMYGRIEEGVTIYGNYSMYFNDDLTEMRWDGHGMTDDYQLYKQ